MSHRTMTQTYLLDNQVASGYDLLLYSVGPFTPDPSLSTPNRRCALPQLRGFVSLNERYSTLDDEQHAE